MELTDSLLADTNSYKLKDDWTLGLSLVKNGCAQSGDRNQKLTLSEEWVDEINWWKMFVQIHKY